MSKHKKLSIEDIYQKKTHHEHVLTLPDTYIGSIEPDNLEAHTFNESTQTITKKAFTYVPGLYKIYDEILVNARDNCVRDPKCDEIKVLINQKTSTITVYNTGEGIPCIIHSEHNVYVPELIFGQLLTSSNYGSEKRTTGGKNGLGGKCCNIFSKEFIIETVDSKEHKKYYQRFYNNMYGKDEPIITKVSKKDKSYTKITFTPDLNKFGIDTLSDDIVSLFKKRVYDIAACSSSHVKVYLNNELININNFQNYIEYFYENNIIPSEPIYESCNERWTVCAIYDPHSGFCQISYVNGICTFQGGTHINYIMDQIVSKLTDVIKDKHKNLNIKASFIRDNLTIFLDCILENPSFSSQTKEYLTSKVASYGSKCEISNDFIKKLAKTGIIDEIIRTAQLKALHELTKSDGKKITNLKGIPKLDDAKLAGSRKAKNCRLILTEGDSAKTFAISGLDIIGRDLYGVFPLRGKLLNVRDASIKQLTNNEEIKNIKLIMGLKQGKKYDDVTKLRYGGIIILTDQDVDGSHIKGLLINFFHFFWPSLVKTTGFIQTLPTPIIKVFKNADVKKKNQTTFYTLTDYQNWTKQQKNGTSGWTVKYYKGLGTSTEKEAKESFTDFDDRVVSFIWNSENKNNNLEIKNIEEHNKSTKNKNESDSESENKNENDNENDNENEDSSNETEYSDNDQLSDIYTKSYDAITLGFAKSRTNDRKKWLKEYKRANIIDNSLTNVSYDDFINKELIHFSNYDNIRSIPSMCDGLKPSQRKVLYSCFEKKLYKDEIKLAQLAAYVAEKTDYHHGEASLQGTIVKMAQNYVGSNNINLLMPIGNFGSRRECGNDAASARYIYTKLSNITKKIFRDEDFPVYNYIIEEGSSIEPEFYSPIIPNILINSTEGIGTGYSTNIPSFNPIDIVNNLLNLLNNKELKELCPWYRNFIGTITQINDHSYQSKGLFEIIDNKTIKITELPIGTWIQKYKEFLDSLVIEDKNKSKTQYLISYESDCGNNVVNFTLTFDKNNLQQLLKTDTLEKKLKLTSSINTSNMHLYTDSFLIKKYENVNDILKDFFTIRLSFYKKRKEYYIQLLENKMQILKYKKLFIDYVLCKPKKIMVERQKKEHIINRLEELEFPQLNENVNSNEKKSYRYITDMPFFNLTEEKIEELENELRKKELELENYKKITIKTLWENELHEFLEEYEKWTNDPDNHIDGDNKKSKKSKKKTKK
jgi:DNA topoisomerase-2